jgi:predicted acyl esterase
MLIVCHCNLGQATGKTRVFSACGLAGLVQDSRGQHGSEGDDAMNRPPHGPQNPTPVDRATDTYDTTEWLVTVIRVQFRTDRERGGGRIRTDE